MVKLNKEVHLRGTALGGFLVLEPWITPSLFYQFLGASEKWGDSAPSHVGIDSLTFCTALGDEEANRQLRQHWKTWVTEEQIANLKAINVEALRIPVGDWMYKPYEPYIGCMDGSFEELVRVLELCRKYGIKVIIDLHALRGSQNGLDNSGSTGNYRWVSTLSTGGAARYDHWDIRAGEWAGDYNFTSQQYDFINTTNIDFSVEVVREMIARHKNDSIVIGIEPVNEPDIRIPLPVLQDYYRRCHELVQAEAPHWITLLHDSFRLTPNNWLQFMSNCTNCIMDSHIYQAWAWVNNAESFIAGACTDGSLVKVMEQAGIPVIVGEWSLATDNCAMWINGLNDNVPGYPKVACARIPCPPPYMGTGQPGAPPNRNVGAEDPFGTGGPSYVINGTCPTDPPFPNNNEVMRKLGLAKLNAFDVGTHGQFFWNFRTEFGATWDYQRAVAAGWLPTSYDDLVVAKQISRACVVKVDPVDYSIFEIHHNALALMLGVLLLMLISMFYPTRHRWLAACFRGRRNSGEYSILPSNPSGFKPLPPAETIRDVEMPPTTSYQQQR